MERAARTGTEEAAGAHAALLAGVGAGVLQALDLEVAAHIGLDGVGLHQGALQGGVTAAADADPVAGRDVRVGVHEVVAGFVAACRTGTGADADAETPDAIADAHAARAGLVAAGEAGGVLGGLQFDVALGTQVGSCPR
nr:hypothetical protein [Hydrogenophaga laconesensis]